VIRYWVADGAVWVSDGKHAIRIPYAEWNAMIERVGHRKREADAGNPP
jgi:hypothetical protein